LISYLILLKKDLLEDRREYEKDLQEAYPQLNDKEIKLLFLKLQKWKFSKYKRKDKTALPFFNPKVSNFLLGF